MKKEIKIIVADDHEIFRKGLITTINRTQKYQNSCRKFKRRRFTRVIR